jgi:fumarylacetoacetase
MLSSWLDVPKNSDFSLENIPFGVCSIQSDGRRHCVTAIGNTVVDLEVLQDAGAFECTSLDPNAFSHSTLNIFLEHESNVWSRVRQQLVDLFAEGKNEMLKSNKKLQQAALYNIDDVKMHLPVEIGDYTDFYSSREHATNSKPL